MSMCFFIHVKEKSILTLLVINSTLVFERNVSLVMVKNNSELNDSFIQLI